MGTNGIFGFYYKGRLYCIYNHFDSHPGGLGKKLIEEIRAALANGTFNDWITMLENIKIIDEMRALAPTKDDIEKMKPYTDLTVSTQSPSDWYCLTRGCQGSFVRVLNSGYLMNQISPKGKPYLHEYRYTLYLDEPKHFEFYIAEKLTASYELSDLPDF